MYTNLTTEEFNAFMEFFIDSDCSIEELHLMDEMDELESPLDED